MTHEQLPSSSKKPPCEVFGFTESERLTMRVSAERFHQIIDNDQVSVHDIKDTSNLFGEFLFVTTSRPCHQGRAGITFFGLGYHEQRERWITEEWFWYRTEINPEMIHRQITKKETNDRLKKRWEAIAPEVGGSIQSERGKLFEILANLTDDDGTMAEMEDIESLENWLAEVEKQSIPQEPPPTGEYLLDDESRAKLPKFYENEELGLEAKALVKFFTPDSNWTWYASEFDGDDIFFGVVSGFEVELGYFSLRELQGVRGPLGLQIERDVNFAPKTLKELLDVHRRDIRSE